MIYLKNIFIKNDEVIDDITCLVIFLSTTIHVPKSESDLNKWNHIINGKLKRIRKKIIKNK